MLKPCAIWLVRARYCRETVRAVQIQLANMQDAARGRGASAMGWSTPWGGKRDAELKLRGQPVVRAFPTIPGSANHMAQVSA